MMVLMPVSQCHVLFVAFACGICWFLLSNTPDNLLLLLSVDKTEKIVSKPLNVASLFKNTLFKSKDFLTFYDASI